MSRVFALEGGSSYHILLSLGHYALDPFSGPLWHLLSVDANSLKVSCMSFLLEHAYSAIQLCCSCSCIGELAYNFLFSLQFPGRVIVSLARPRWVGSSSHGVKEKQPLRVQCEVVQSPHSTLPFILSLLPVESAPQPGNIASLT